MQAPAPSPPVRPATAADAPAVAALLHAFNTEYDEPVPEQGLLAERIRDFIESDEAVFLLAGEGPDGFASVRFRPSLITGELDAYLEELYVVPSRRGHGLGRALLEAAMERSRERGATYMDLGTAHSDTAARGLYESAGFTNTGGNAEGDVNYFYEREL